MTPDYLTPDEIQCLRLVRARAMLDRGDIAPMLRIVSRTEAEVIPLIASINLEVPLR